MQRALVMTVLGKDKPGLVESISAIVAEHSGNWLESRMSRLGGFFAGILRVEVPADKEPGLAEALSALGARGLEVVVHPDQAMEPTPKTGILRRVELVGQDHPGIVRQISQALANQNINVEELTTETSSAAMSGETLFRAEAILRLPPDCDVLALKSNLERIAADLIVDITFHEATADLA